MALRTYLLKDLGDFQTPLALAEVIANRFTQDGRQWKRILEPTCGKGNFIRAFSHQVDAGCHIQGVELQAQYVGAAREIVCPGAVQVDIHQASIFDLRLDKLHWHSSGELLVIGNPPWVTNAALGSLDSSNLPRKVNLKGLSGIDALTGESNFDIAESIWLKIISELLSERPTIALLCKTSVARSVLSYAYARKWPIIAASIHRIDAKKWFGAAVDAALFTVQLGEGTVDYACPVYADLCSRKPEAVIGFVAGRMVADVHAPSLAACADGDSPFIWRQGIKHDAVSVMEIVTDSPARTNKLGERVDVEMEWVYPLLKSSDLCQTAPPQSRRMVILPQERIGQDTKQLQAKAPKLWRYLTDHQEHFDKRKSSIYTNQPPFSIFGVGDYSFAPYKVAVAGLTKTPKFWPLAPVGGRPVMLDDTCYFLPCQTAEQAQVLSAALNGPLCSDLLRALMFSDSKRPVTKKLLQRINVMRLLASSLDELELFAAKQALAPLLTQASSLQQTVIDL